MLVRTATIIFALLSNAGISAIAQVSPSAAHNTPKMSASVAADAIGQTPEGVTTVRHSGKNVRQQSGLYVLYGLNFGPYENGQDPNVDSYITPAQIQSRLQAIAPYTQWIRSYSMTNGLDQIAPIAKSLGLKVAAGASISSWNFTQNDLEVANLIAAANAGYVDVAVVGNEAVSLQGVTAIQLAGYMNYVRGLIPASIPVTTAEIYTTLLANQNLIDASDLLMVNIYPFWEGRPISSGACSLATDYNRVIAQTGGKKVVISEAGWPSGGGEPSGSWASPVNAGQYFLQFISWARANGVPYFYFEAYDEAWKAQHAEGPPGAYWGIWDQYGLMKPLMQPVFDGTTVPVDCLLGGVGTPQILFNYVPPYGDTIDNFPLEGMVQHVLPWQYNVAVYIQVGGQWWTKPTFAQPITSIQGDGTWSASINTGGNDVYAGSVAAFLIPVGYSPPVLNGVPSLPQTLYDNSVANLQVSRSTSSISGQVLGPGPGATVTLSGAENQVATSGLQGEYSFYNLSSTGPYTVTGSGLGLNYDAPQTFSNVTAMLRAIWIHAFPIPADSPGVYIEAPTRGQAVSGTIPITGWALDTQTAPGTNLSGVDVQVDGASLGNSTYGWFRPDVCNVYPGRPDCPNVGFKYLIDASKLSAGNHTIQVCATDTDVMQTDTTCQSLNFSVSATIPSVFIDSPANGATVSGTLNVLGWAIDNASTIGTAIGSVQVQVDGIAVGTASYGGLRPDVCAVFPGRPGCPNVGYSYALNTTGLSAGAHTLTVCATDTDATPATGCQSVSITVPTVPSVFIDSPANGATVSGTLNVLGWAIDNASTIGTAIGSVQVQVDGIAVGTASYGGLRPDVCAVFPGRPGCPNVGYSYALNTTGLSAGAHTLTVCATDTDATPATGCQSVSITVPTVPSVFIDSPANGATVSGTLNVLGWAIDNASTIGTAIGSVQVQVDGIAVGTASYGGLRPDVCAVFPGRPGCPNVGYSYALNTTGLSAGAHTLTVCATDTDATPATGCQSVSITVPTVPSVFIDSPANGATVSGTLNVLGWAIDNASTIGTAIGSVQVQVDGIAVGTASYGGLRPDVCAVFPGRPGCPNVGYSYALNTTGLSAGAHTLTVCATDTDATPATGCQSASITATNATVTKIDVSPLSAPILLGVQQQYTALGTFSDGSQQDITNVVTWASSNPSEVSITSSGLATGAAVTTAPVTITASYQGLIGTVTVTVDSANLVSIAITPGNINLAQGTSRQFIATGTLTNGSTLNITNQTSWTSSDTTIATLGPPTGWVHAAVSVANASNPVTITATLGSVSQQVTVNVTNATPTSITVTPITATIQAGATQLFSATGTFSDATTQDITFDSSWVSSDTTLAFVTFPGRLQGVAATPPAGIPITASFGGQTGTATLIVSTATLTSIAVTPQQAILAPGSSLTYQANGTYSDGSTANLSSLVTWASSTSSVASITTGGVATGQSAGTSSISATYQGVTSNSAAVLVTASPLVSVAVLPLSATVPQGVSTQLQAIGTFADNSTQNLTTSVNWASLSPTVATISNAFGRQGVATGVAPGQSNITAVFAGVSGSGTLTVTNATLQSIAVTPANPTVSQGGTQLFNAKGTFSDGSLVDLTTQVSWTSSNATVATMNGALASAASPGTTTITATFTQNGVQTAESTTLTVQ